MVTASGGAPRHGRRAQNGAAGMLDEADGGPQGTGPVEQVMRMQLRAGVGADFKPQLQTVAKEYATRYLEQLGIAPSKSTLDLVHRHVPLTEKNIATTLRAKGHVSDELQLLVPPVTHAFRVPKVIHAHDILQLGITNGETKSPQAEDSAAPADERAINGGGSARQGTGQDAAAAADSDSVPGNQFRHMASRYLHPFQLDVSLAHAHLQQLEVELRPAESHSAMDPASVLKRSQSVSIKHVTSFTQKVARAAMDPDTRGGLGGGDGGDGTGGWDPELLRLEICEELLQELESTPEVVYTLLAQVESALVDWFRHQAPETLKGRLTGEEFKATLELLTAEGSVNFFVTLFNFLHQEYVRSSPSYPKELEARMTGSKSMLRERGSSSLSRQSLSRRSSMQNLGGSASLNRSGSFHNAPATLATTWLQNLDKYDLGYKHWLRQKKAAESKAAAEAAAASKAAASKRFPQQLAAAQAAQSPRQHKGPKRAVSFNKKKDVHDFDPFAAPHAHAHLRTAPSVAGPDSVPGSPSHTPLAPRSSLRFQEPPNTGKGHAGRASAAASARFGGGGVAAGSSTSGAAAAVNRTASPPPEQFVSLTALAKKSLAHLPAMKALTETVSHANAGPRRLTSKDTLALQQSRLFVMQTEMAKLYALSRQTRAGMFFTLPVFLVTARLLVHMLFTGVYRLWARTREGYQAIQQMDEAIEHLFDPHGYLQRNLSILQSSPAAVSLMAKYPHKSHEPERLHFADVSPLMRAAMTDPASAGARRLMHQGAQHKRARERRGSLGPGSSHPAGDRAGGAAAPNRPHSPRRGDEDYERTLLEALAPDRVAQGPLKTKLTQQQRDALFRIVLDGLSGPEPPGLAALPRT